MYVYMYIQVFWDVISCRLANNYRLSEQQDASKFRVDQCHKGVISQKTSI